jgi:translocation and assembly module TamB
MGFPIFRQLKRLRLKGLLILSCLAVFIALAVFISRGPHISNYLKKIILPEIEAASGQKVMAQKIYLNVFPLFVEAKDMKVFDGNGNRILAAPRVKGYIDLSGLFFREISIRRLVIKDAEISSDLAQIEGIVGKVIAYLEKNQNPFIKVDIKAIEVVSAAAVVRDENTKSMLRIKSFGGSIILGKNPRLNTTIAGVSFKKAGWPEFPFDINATAVFADNRVDIQSLQVNTYGSELKGGGHYSVENGAFRPEISLLVGTVKRIFGLRQKDEGRIYAKGEFKSKNAKFKIQSLDDILIDLKLNGDFYLETLMELLNVTEKVEGRVDFRGEISGPLNNFSGKAKASLYKGNLFSVEIDSLRCDVNYMNRVLSFRNGSGEVYNGCAQAEASFNLPYITDFDLRVRFDSVDSTGALGLIDWKPPIPFGKVSGELFSSGSGFDPEGWFVYTAQPQRKTENVSENVLDRIKDIKGNYSLRGTTLSLFGLMIHTSHTRVVAGGEVNIEDKSLNLNSVLETDDVTDLTSPYYFGVKGKGDFTGKVTGTFDNPEIAGTAAMKNGVLEGYETDSISSRFSYNRNLLTVHETRVISGSGEQHLSGKISFPNALELFDLRKPVYHLDASLRDTDIEGLMRMLPERIAAAGRMYSEFTISGEDRDIMLAGNASVAKAAINQFQVDSLSTAFSYHQGEITLRQTLLKSGETTVTGEGGIFPDERFFFRVSSDRFRLRDINLQNLPEDIIFSLSSEGSGTLKNPIVSVDATMLEGSISGRPAGKGTIHAQIQNLDVVLSANLFSDKVRINGTARLEPDLPWSASVDIDQGRYDFILSHFIKDIPEEFQLILKGRIEMKGDKRNLTASAILNHLALTMSEYNFSNDKDIRIQLDNKRLSFPAFALKYGTTAFRVIGDMDIGREYNVLLQGSSSLSPFRGLSKKIGLLRGDADFSFSITGKWDKPEINGWLNMRNGSFGLKNYYTYASSVNGYLYMEKDRIVVKKLTGKVGGGDVDISGVVYLSGLGIKGFFLEAALGNITSAVSKDFTVNFGGNILYKGTPDKQTITGEIKINRAKYRKRVEWKSWLLLAKETPRIDVSRFDNTELNIRLSGSDNIYIDNNIARTQIKIDMVLRGLITKPAILGRLESKGGSVFFRNNEFRIIYASADFTDPDSIKPAIRLSAETITKGYKVKLNLEGQLDSFNLSLSSDPPLQETDILALMTVGQVGKQLKGLEGGIGAGEATSFLTGRIQDVLEERLRTFTGIDRFSVEPYVSKATGTVGPRVTVSKKLIGDKLLVTYTNPLGATEEQILKLEYLLSQSVSLIGMRDEKGSVGGDIKFRFEFK